MTTVYRTHNGTKRPCDRCEHPIKPGDEITYTFDGNDGPESVTHRWCDPTDAVEEE